MDMTLRRTQFSDNGIFGELRSPDGSIVCVTLEHSYPINTDESVEKMAKIPPGTYLCKKRMSPRFKYFVFQVAEVPGHEFIEIHKGNFNRDSEGCILLGQNIVPYGGGLMITNSGLTYDRFMGLQKEVNEFKLTVLPYEFELKKLG